MKTCYTCKETKPVGEFTRRKDRDAYRSDCKECYNRKARLRNNNDKELARLAVTKEHEAIAKDPYGFLVAGIIEKAIRDLKDDETRGDALAFFCGAWFEELCGLIDMDVDYLRKHIL